MAHVISTASSVPKVITGLPFLEGNCRHWQLLRRQCQKQFGKLILQGFRQCSRQIDYFVHGFAHMHIG